MAKYETKNEEGETCEAKYLIVKAEMGGILDLLKLLVLNGGRVHEFVESSEVDGDGGGEWDSGGHRWVIVVSVIMRRIIGILGKPMEGTGMVIEFLLNLLDLNGGIYGLFLNLIKDYQKKRSTQVFILSDKPKDATLVLISFRGTEPFDADDWSTDVDYSWYEIPKLGKVHMGFLEALGLGNRAQISTFQNYLQPKNQANKDTAYYAVKSKLESLLHDHKDAKFVVTGHSLGGALAILFPVVLLLHDEHELMKRLLAIYTFGQPRVGDENLVSFMKAQLCEPMPRYFRAVYCNDIVPRLPYDDSTFLYKHFGLCLYYNSLYSEQNVEEEPNRNYFGLRYLIPEHLNAVWELIRCLMISHVYGPEYEEGWFSIFIRVFGLFMPGVSAHSPRDYVNCVRLGRGRIQMDSI
ncbi:uncharacterized protein LOC109844917 isoform X2 [Asparagus officinalis]|uniref:uncharacterized protein LOC109844917 isoform X2 n=1 Tax=Asparagus officinalis TaxID=4686 RepID=UPI00098E645F|nr:uncharacterized protein LOC109844917 isoform X2 [Asparagus officinalis]